MWNIDECKEIEKIQELCVEKIIENIEQTKSFIASPSIKNPDYVYHWTRDAALTMRVIVDKYDKTKESKYFQILIKYINCEYELQQLYTLSGLGEPKYNVDRSAFNDAWGRPQNDGPALRGMVMLKILPFLIDEYISIANKMVIPMIKNDAEYIFRVVENHCFDLWEESDAYHFYTRVVQCKFMKELAIYFYDNPSGYFDEDELLCINIKFERYRELINHHYDHYSVISSFDKNGNSLRIHDASIILALCHIDYDRQIIGNNKYYLIDNNIFNLICYFNEKYYDDNENNTVINEKEEEKKNGNYTMIGRYMNDKYYDGHIWILCTLGMAQYLFHRRDYYNNFDDDQNNPHDEEKQNMIKTFLKPEKIVKNILDIDSNLNLAEQYDPKQGMQISAKKLSWNYSELYFALEKAKILSLK